MSEQETPVQLSERELQVLEMVATGASNQQIAQQLVISVNTVKVHLRNIFEKLGVQSRTEATLRAIKEGLITVPEDKAQATETPPPLPSKTYVHANGARPILARWQQLYLVLAGLLALGMMIIPLAPRQALYLPVIIPYDKQQPTPGPSAPANPNSKQWTFHAAIPTSRAGLGLAALDGRLFAVGGRRDIGTTGLLEIYDSSTDSWSEGAAKPTATADVSAAVLDGKIYVPGGCDDERQPVTNLEVYDPEEDTWAQGPALPEGRCGYGLVAWQDKLLYLFGGWNGQAYEDTIFVFLAEKKAWEVLDTVMPQPKGYFGVVNLDDKIYVVGGYDGHTEFDQTYVFLPDSGDWVKKAPMHEKRGGLGLATAAGNIYAIGGGWERPLDASEMYDPKADKWTIFEAPFSDQWNNMGLASIDTKVYAVGGWNGVTGKYMDSLVSYQFFFRLFLPISK